MDVIQRLSLLIQWTSTQLFTATRFCYKYRQNNAVHPSPWDAKTPRNLPVSSQVNAVADVSFELNEISLPQPILYFRAKPV